MKNYNCFLFLCAYYTITIIEIFTSCITVLNVAGMLVEILDS